MLAYIKKKKVAHQNVRHGPKRCGQHQFHFLPAREPLDAAVSAEFLRQIEIVQVSLHLFLVNGLIHWHIQIRGEWIRMQMSDDEMRKKKRVFERRKDS